MHCGGLGRLFSGIRDQGCPGLMLTDALNVQHLDGPVEGEDNEDESESGDQDIEAQIQREVAGLKPSPEKPRRFQAIRMDIPCGLSRPGLAAAVCEETDGQQLLSCASTSQSTQSSWCTSYVSKRVLIRSGSEVAGFSV